jgi:cytochrome b561
VSALAEPRHDRLARALHWIMAPLIALQLALGLLGERLEDPQLAWLLLVIHFQLGIVLLVLLAVRIGWRLRARARPQANSRAGWLNHAATTVHLALYILLLLLPASGYVIWVWMNAPLELLGIVQVPALFVPPPDDESGRALAWYVHVYGAYVLMIVVAVHVGAAVWHYRSGKPVVAARGAGATPWWLLR